MSYCVHCGVELEKGTASCPLCGTPVLDPHSPEPGTVPDFFPTRPVQIPPVSKRVMALLLTSMLVSVSVCCALLNLVLQPRIPWNLFVIGAAIMLWVWTVFPLLARKVPLWGKLMLDVAAVGVYVWIISLALDGRTWFRGLAIPILIFSAVGAGVLGWLLRSKHSILSSFTMLLAAMGVYCVGIEICCDWFAYGKVLFGWSLVVFTCCVGLCIPLLVVRCVPSLREEVRRRFHF